MKNLKQYKKQKHDFYLDELRKVEEQMVLCNFSKDKKMRFSDILHFKSQYKHKHVEHHNHGGGGDHGHSHGDKHGHDKEKGHGHKHEHKAKPEPPQEEN